MKTKFSQKIADTIVEMICSDSYTVREICRAVNISKQTFYNWQAAHPDFAKSVEYARIEYMDLMKVNAEKSLLKRIQGENVTETIVRMKPTGKRDESGKPEATVKEIVTTTRHIPPDTKTLIFILTNQDPVHWKQRISLETKVKKPSTPIEKKSDEQLDAGIKKMMTILNEEKQDPSQSIDEMMESTKDYVKQNL